VDGIFTNIPLHTKIRVKFKSYTIDSWDTETVYYTIQSSVFSRTFNLNDGFGNLCGGGYPDKYFGEVFEISHSADTFNVRFSFGLDEDSLNGIINHIVESWGFRDFVIQILPV
jgi:hypothetical protein